MAKDSRTVRGFALIEVMVTGIIVGTAALGAAVALVSGISLEARSERTMTEVATAENVLARIRHTSQSNFPTLPDTYDASTHASRESVGIRNATSRPLRVSVPLSEAGLPGTIDLDGDGEFDGTATGETARLLVVDVEGSDSLRLRTAVLNFDKMDGVILDRDANSGDRPVTFGETREPPPEGDEDEGDETIPDPEPLTEESTVNVVSSSLEGKAAVIVLENISADDRRPTSITIAPSDKKLYFESIRLDGHPIFTPGDDQSPGTVTIELASTNVIEPGEARIDIGDFFKIDKKKGKQPKAPKDVVVTIAFDDGSVQTVTVK